MAGLLESARRLLGRAAGGREAPLAAEARYAVLDLEMTGLDPRLDAVVALGAVRMAGSRILLGQGFSALVRPAAPLRVESIRIHRITPAEVRDLPPACETLARFHDFLGQAVLVGWCLDLDLAFLAAEAGRCRLPRLGNAAVDVRSLYAGLARQAQGRLPEVPAKDLTLYSLAQAMGMAVAEAHDALSDAYLTAQVFQRLLALLPGASLARLVALGRLEAQHHAHFNLG